MTKLIITNGDSAVERMVALGLADKILPWRDVLHEGPVPYCATLREQSKQRAVFLADFATMPVEDVLADLTERDDTFLHSASYDRVELWFEHDLYDQLQLMQILSAFYTELPHVDVYLVQADDYLAEIDMTALSSLSEQAVLIDRSQKEYAHQAWRAFTSDTPDLMNDLLQKDAPFQYMQKALERTAQEYPNAVNGLSLSGIYALRPLLEKTTPIKTLFKEMQKSEEAKFMGDLSFAHMMDGFIKAGVTMISGAKSLDEIDYMDFFNQEISLTPFGRDVLKDKDNYIEANGIERWIGGVHLKSS